MSGPANRREHSGQSGKEELVTTLNDVFKKTSVVVVAHYSGLTVAQMQTLRKQMHAAGATVKVAKNRLAKIALEGTDVASIASLLQGADPDRLFGRSGGGAKVAVDFAKDNDKLVILGGAMGTTALEPRRREGARDHAVARRAARQARRPHPGARRPSSPSSPLRRRPSSRACSGPMPNDEAA